ncbi:YolD-like family protein [Macrococcus canis]|uniref:YolD-like family protein n=1 Tax=Macrococcoides canis TaxID=1855823 RepID=UPI00207C5036|nr:YolD-like family protein [Macrococcus canis]MCO4096977.1 YolD-like family protein [Macrococcus canis]
MKAHNINVNHPIVPKEFENETNYKKIPSEYLSRDIPRGRGMVKWAPMATMPQLYRDIENKIQAQSNIQKPMLSEDQLEEINRKLHQYSTSKIKCNVYYHEDAKICRVEAVIHKINQYKNRIDMYINEEDRYIELEMKNVIEII